MTREQHGLDQLLATAFMVADTVGIVATAERRAVEAKFKQRSLERKMVIRRVLEHQRRQVGGPVDGLNVVQMGDVVAQHG
jgi:hypothetical protein